MRTFIGSAVYLGRWLDDGVNFIQRNQAMLATKPVWLFSSGPVGVVKSGPNGDPLEQALGPADGPGSGGRKRITGLAVLIQPRDHHVFAGVYDPTDPPKSMQERFVRMLPAGKATLPSADFRDWVDITKWSRSIAAQLSPVEVH
jgi:menaquinone-dependent protoporphyrinogen oxidase